MNIGYDDEDMQKRLKEAFTKLVPEAIKRGMTNACLIVEGEAKDICPVDDGILRASITHAVSDDGSEGEIGTAVEYAPYVHEGTGIYATEGHGRQTPWTYCDAEGKFHTTEGQKPQPFLRDAAESKRDEILKCFEGELK